MNIPVGVSLGNVQGGHWGFGSPVAIDGKNHAAFIGATGSGKTIALLNLIRAHIEMGHGVTVIDPHGDLADRVAAMIPRHRERDVIWLDPLSKKKIGLNPLYGKNKQLRSEQFKRIVAEFFGESSWLASSDYVGRNVLTAIAEAIPNPTPLHFWKFFNDPVYAKRLFATAKSPNLRSFYAKTQELWDKRQREQVQAAPANKADILLKPNLKLIIGQEVSLDVRKMIDTNKIMIFRLDKGRLGPEDGDFLATIALWMILFAAFERADVPGEKRPLHIVVVDEVQNVTKGSSLEYILTEARKFNVFLVAATQLLLSLDERMREQLLANVGTLGLFTVGRADAEALAPTFGVPDPKYIQDLPRGQFLMRSKRDGNWGNNIRVKGLAPPPLPNSPLKIIRRTEHNYGIADAENEDAINRFLEPEVDDAVGRKGKPAPAATRRSGGRTAAGRGAQEGRS